MRRTLLLIPHEIAGLPVFGFGWLLILLAIGLGIRWVLLVRSKQPLADWLSSEGLLWLLMGGAIAFLLPAVELRNVDGDPVGMAIRGYGVMLVVAVSASVFLAAVRARRRGINPEWIYALAPWVLIGGIAGARVFYVVQYRDKFLGDTWGQTLLNMLKFTEGGLVVYGSFIGGTLAAVVFILRNRLPLLKLGDAIVPCMFLGLFFGRIGCLLNGCCYGGKCDDHWSAIQFPPGSPVYEEQLFEGSLLGLHLDPVTRRIDAVEPDSLADRAGIQANQVLQSMSYDREEIDLAAREIPEEDVRRGLMVVVDGRVHRWSAVELPATANPVFPAQVISSISALGFCLVLCGLSLFAWRDGTIMLLGFGGYAVLRFTLEQIRVDEAGQFGTQFSISQWVSMVVLALSLGGLAWLYWRPPTTPVVEGP